MNAKVPGVDFKEMEAYKIMLRMTTADSLSITRLGDTIRLDDYWATLSVFLPQNIDEQVASDSLLKVYPFIINAELNYFGTFHDEPNDILYSTNQSGLFNLNYGINIEPAWGIQKGQNYTSVGVFDTGINWKHEDFGDGTWDGSKLYGGWDYHFDVHPSNSQPLLDWYPSGHGTKVAGIIGALRNNNLGIAGIAGGDEDSNNSGAALFAMNIQMHLTDQGGCCPQQVATLYSNIFRAIIEGAVYVIDESGDVYGYGLHVQNHSWGGQVFSSLIMSAVKSCYKHSCIFVASSGNTGNSQALFPSSYNDDWVLKVGGSNIFGEHWEGSTFGNSVDIVAPCVPELMISPSQILTNGYVVNEGGATSWAAPYASGVAALMHSEHNTNNEDHEYPNNLAPEDIEFLIQKYATDIPPAGYDLETGYGRLNAGYVLENMSLPESYILHLGGNPTLGNPVETITNNQLVSLTYNTNGVNSGAYNANLHQIKQTYVVTLPEGSSVIDDWKRYSSSNGTSNIPVIENSDYFNYSIDINQNVVTVTSYTWCWFITTNINQGPVYKWVPGPPQHMTSAVSLQIRNSLQTSVSEVDNLQVLSFFPNPSKDGLFTVQYNLLSKKNLTLIVTDIIGRKVAQLIMDDKGDGLKQSELDLSMFSSGVYICYVRLDDGIRSQRIIIQ